MPKRFKEKEKQLPPFLSLFQKVQGLKRSWTKKKEC
jgi:hypothetical protein